MCYFVKSITEEGETYVRDLSGLFQYLQSHFPELHISFSFHRNITSEMILKRLQAKGIKIGSEADLNIVKNNFNDVNNELSEIENDTHFFGRGDPLINELFTDLNREKKHELEALKKEGIKHQNLVQRTQKLMKEYERKGYGASLVITASSTLQLSYGTKDFTDCIRMIQKELLDQHRFIIRQKFGGGLLHIYLEKMTDPLLMNQIQLAGMVLSPRQLKTMGKPVQELYEKVVKVMPAWPSEDVKVNGHVVDQRKLTAAKLLQIFLKKVERHKPDITLPENLPTQGGLLGFIVDNQAEPVPFFYPINTQHVYISGKTASMKSGLARVYCEGMLIEGINVLIIDRTSQWCGLGLPCQQEEVLEYFDKFQIPRSMARGFECKIFTPNGGPGSELPKDLTELFSGCNIVSTKHLSRIEHLEVTLNILQTLYDFLNQETGGQIKLATIFEEAHSFLSHKLKGKEKILAQGVEKLIEDCTREKGKYGGKFVFVTQSISDFRQSTRAVRDQVDCRFFLRSTDLTEGKYIEHYLGKEFAEMVKNFQPGESIIFSPMVSGVKFFVRPPFSSLREPSDDEIRAINCRWQSAHYAPRRKAELSNLEDRALNLIKESQRSGKTILATELDKKLRISGGTRQRLIDGMADKGLIEKVTIKRGAYRPSLGLISLE